MHAGGLIPGVQLQGLISYCRLGFGELKWGFGVNDACWWVYTINDCDDIMVVTVHETVTGNSCEYNNKVKGVVKINSYYDSNNVTGFSHGQYVLSLL